MASRRSAAPKPDPQTATAAIIEGVREEILSGRYRPGARIGQESLAEEYGVSRLPVREALRALESEGLVTLIPHSGARVAELDVNACIEIYRLREAIEPLLVADSGPRLSEAALLDLHQRADAIEAATGDLGQWLTLDREFHLAVYEPTHMKHALWIARRLWNQSQHFRRALVAELSTDELGYIHMEHRLILNSIERGDHEDAGRRLAAHIRRTRFDLLSRAHHHSERPD